MRHTVPAVARDPGRLDLPDSPSLTRVAADVTDPGSVAAALRGSEVVLSGLGVAKGRVIAATAVEARGATETEAEAVRGTGDTLARILREAARTGRPAVTALARDHLGPGRASSPPVRGRRPSGTQPRPSGRPGCPGVGVGVGLGVVAGLVGQGLPGG
jgi:uncharacterized protein YbjT (DUF2867 family)